MRVTLFNAQQGHTALARLWHDLKPLLIAGKRIVVEVREATRSLEQNARMWAMLEDVSAQVEWYGRKLTPEEWKHVFSASLKGQDVVPGLYGGFVVLGVSTSRMTIREMGELMTLMEAFGAERGVRFGAPEHMEAHA